MPDRIEIHDLRVDCVIGVLEVEQRTLQPLVIDLSLELELDDAASGDLGASVNYATVAEGARFLAEHGRFRLIESLAAAIARMVLAPAPPSVRQAPVERVQVRIRKPAILEAAVPGLVIERDAEWRALPPVVVPEKTWLNTLVETPTTGAYRADLEPAASFPVPPGAALLVVSGVCTTDDGRRVSGGQRLARGEVARLSPAGGAPASVLVVTSPPLSVGAM